MQLTETEVKFFIFSHESVRSRIKKIDASNSGRYFEKNICYDNRNRDFKKKQILLRLRQANIATLTVKKPIKTENSEFKINHEFEVIVDDFAMMESALKILGYQKIRIYEKWRETWEMNKTKLCLDTLPFGKFLEIEGNPQKIKNISAKLRLNWNNRIVSSYLEIFETIKKKESLKINDLTFSEFKNISICFEKYRYIFECSCTS